MIWVKLAGPGFSTFEQMASECFHCGLAVLDAGRHRVIVLGRERSLCCTGCEAVARTIVAAGFESYYETRTSPAAPPPAVVPQTISSVSGKGDEASLILDRVRCAACLWLIEQAMRMVPGVLRADVNYATKRAHVTWAPEQADLERIVGAVRAVGYDAYPYEAARDEAVERRERRGALWRLFVAGFGAMQVMMYAFPAYIDEGAGTLGPDAVQLMRWASLLLTLPVVFFSCKPFFDGALRELRNRRLGLDTPLALGIAGGFAASAWATVTASGEVYFDSISMLAFLLLAARYVEAAARRRAARALDPLLKPGKQAGCAAGELVNIAPGERVPADGLVEAGVSSADESLLTGESRAVSKRPGDELIAGSVNLEQPLRMRVVRVGADTRAGTIARLVERAAASKPRLVEAADTAARGLTYVILAVALLAYLYSGNLWIAVAILVATCPCALALASPIVLTRAGTALLGRGVLLTRTRALEPLDRATDVVLDKTGTVTEGRVALARVLPLGTLDEAACTRLAAALEKAGRHPVAAAFQGTISPAADSIRHYPGQGVEGVVEGRLLRIGSPGFCEALCAQPRPGRATSSSALQGEVYLADEHGWLAAFQLEDAFRPAAVALVDALRRRGLQVHLCSGDRADIVSAVARKLGIEHFAGGMTPENKLAYVERLQGEGRVVAMIGDGLNDTPVLARADVSIAMGSGADATQLRSDLVLMGSDLLAVPEALALARRAMRLVRQNLAWSIAYNALALPLAAAGWIGPWEAALGMGASSVLVLLNALRPVYFGKEWKASTSSFPSRSLSYS